MIATSNLPNAQWRLQDAKSQFSLLVNSALRGVPQHVTRRGKQAVVVLSEQDFAALQRNAKAQVPSFVGHLLAMPRAESSPDALDTTRAELALREVDF